MSTQIIKSEIKELIDQRYNEFLQEQQKNTLAVLALREEIIKSKEEILASLFSESKKFREEIGSQTMLLKTLEDNFSDMQFDDNLGISSKIEVSVGGEIFGTGAKWVLDIDVTKASYQELIESVLNIPGIPQKVKTFAISKIQKLYSQS